LAAAQRPGLGDRLWGLLRAFWGAALVWGLAEVLSGFTLSRTGPVVPWRGEPVLSNSGSELVQNMALGALLALCGNMRSPRPEATLIARVGGFAGLLFAVTTRARGVRVGLTLALVLALVIAFGKGGRVGFHRRLVAAMLLGALALGTYAAVTGEDVATLMHLERFAEASLDTPVGTTFWRLLWWERLTDEILAHNALFGLGFGQSLGVYNPYLVGDDQTNWPVRSPHNFNLTVFARMGWAGLLTWAAILFLGPGVLFMRLWKGGFRGAQYAARRKEELLFCVVMLVVSWGNSTFGVLLEGPALAVPFWFVLGFAAARSVARGHDARVALARCGS